MVPVPYLLLLGHLLAQACGSPFYWSQPDCYRQTMDDSVTSYEELQGPSYQESLRAMMEETVRAFCDIARITVQAMKQELAELSRIWYRSDCPPGGATGGFQEDAHHNDSPDHVVFPEPPMELESSLGPSKPIDVPQPIEISENLEPPPNNLNKIGTKDPMDSTFTNEDENSHPYEVEMDFGCVNGICPDLADSHSATMQSVPTVGSSSNSTTLQDVTATSKNSSEAVTLQTTTNVVTNLITTGSSPSIDMPTVTSTTWQMPAVMATTEVTATDLTSTSDWSSTTDVTNPGITSTEFRNPSNVYMTTLNSDLRSRNPKL